MDDEVPMWRKDRHWRRRAAMRKVLPGFPRETPFTTREEVDEYLGGEQIQCLMCGKMYKQLSFHLSRIHEMTTDEYKERFGLPWRRGLCAAPITEMRREHGHMIFEKHKEEMLDRLDKHRDEAAVAPHRERAAFRKAELARQGAEIHGLEAPYEDDILVEFLRRLSKGDRTAKEVSSDEDMPGLTHIRARRRSDPFFSAWYDNVIAGLPVSTLAKMEKVAASKEFIEDAFKLYASGWTQEEIGEKYGISQTAVGRAMSAAGYKFKQGPRPERRKSREEE